MCDGEDLSQVMDPSELLQNGSVVYLMPQIVREEESDQETGANKVSFNSIVKVEYVDKYIR